MKASVRKLRDDDSIATTATLHSDVKSLIYCLCWSTLTSSKQLSFSKSERCCMYWKFLLRQNPTLADLGSSLAWSCRASRHEAPVQGSKGSIAGQRRLAKAAKAALASPLQPSNRSQLSPGPTESSARPSQRPSK